VPHLTSEGFNYKVAGKSSHIPYKSGQHVLLELAANHLTHSFATINAMEFAQQNKKKAPGITAAEGDRQHPDQPKLSKQGLPNFDASIGLALLAPKGMPTEILETLKFAAQHILPGKDLVAKIRDIDGITIDYHQQLKRQANPSRGKSVNGSS
jgi:tripartite-type tricarboxylate transporter receptor subunit TctC